MSGWSFEHSVHAAVAPDVAWRFWTDVGNWLFDTSIEWVKLEPGFVTGAKGLTKPRGADPLEWTVRDVGDHRAAIEMLLPDATVTFRWSFEPDATGGTRITQQATLSGPNAANYIGIADSELASGIPQGMQKMAEMIERRAIPASARTHDTSC